MKQTLFPPPPPHGYFEIMFMLAAFPLISDLSFLFSSLYLCCRTLQHYSVHMLIWNKYFLTKLSEWPSTHRQAHKIFHICVTTYVHGKFMHSSTSRMFFVHWDNSKEKTNTSSYLRETQRSLSELPTKRYVTKLFSWTLFDLYFLLLLWWLKDGCWQSFHFFLLSLPFHFQWKLQQTSWNTEENERIMAFLCQYVMQHWK